MPQKYLYLPSLFPLQALYQSSLMKCPLLKVHLALKISLLQSLNSSSQIRISSSSPRCQILLSYNRMVRMLLPHSLLRHTRMALRYHHVPLRQTRRKVSYYQHPPSKTRRMPLYHPFLQRQSRAMLSCHHTPQRQVNRTPP